MDQSENLDSDTLLTPAQVSKSTTLSEKTLAKWRCDKTANDLPYMKLGKLVRYRAGDLKAFLDRNTKKHEA